MPIPLKNSGFTLAELAIVLVIVALLTGGMMMSLSTQQAIQQRTQTERQLNEIRDAMLGFAASNGRLPCPATDASNGLEYFCNSESDCSTPTTVVPASHGRCQQFFNGYVPGATLGLAPLDNQGRVLDAWNNPIRYSIADVAIDTTNYAFTKKDGIKTGKLENTSGASGPITLFTVCETYPGSLSATDCDSASHRLTNTPPLIILSTGQKGNNTTNNDALTNRNNDKLFVSHTPTPTNGTDPGFDDIVVWLSPNILYNRMIAAGRLP